MQMFLVHIPKRYEHQHCIIWPEIFTLSLTFSVWPQKRVNLMFPTIQSKQQFALQTFPIAKRNKVKWLFLPSLPVFPQFQLRIALFFPFKKIDRIVSRKTLFLRSLASAQISPHSPYLNGFVFIGRNLSCAVKRFATFNCQWRS